MEDLAFINISATARDIHSNASLAQHGYKALTSSLAYHLQRYKEIDDPKEVAEYILSRPRLIKYGPA